MRETEILALAASQYKSLYLSVIVIEQYFVCIGCLPTIKVPRELHESAVIGLLILTLYLYALPDFPFGETTCPTTLSHISISFGEFSNARSTCSSIFCNASK